MRFRASESESGAGMPRAHGWRPTCAAMRAPRAPRAGGPCPAQHGAGRHGSPLEVVPCSQRIPCSQRVLAAHPVLAARARSAARLRWPTQRDWRPARRLGARSRTGARHACEGSSQARSALRFRHSEHRLAAVGFWFQPHPGQHSAFKAALS